MKQYSKAVKKSAAGTLAVVVGLVGAAGSLVGTGVFDTAAAERVQPLFKSAYSSKAEAMQAGLDLNVRIAEEGMVLLRNKNNALPIASGGVGGAKVTVFGRSGTKPFTGGSANGGDASAGVAGMSVSLYDSIESAGFGVNPVVRSRYEKWIAETEKKEVVDWQGNPVVEEVPVYPSDASLAQEFAKESAKWTDSYKTYNDAALIVISGGSNAIGNTDNQRIHTLQIDKEQYDLIDSVVGSGDFKRVVLLINSCTPLELDMSKLENVDAILQIGEPGDNGLAALGKVLSGRVTPSGRLTDTWAKDFTKDPSYHNFNTRTDSSAWSVDGNGAFTGYTRYKVDGKLVNTWSVGYEEGIYTGYRYYETRAFDEGGDWWSDNVNFTFGQGLSYTTFDWELVGEHSTTGDTVTKDTSYTFDVKVTNTGNYSGKEVVQMYYTAPYVKGVTKLEKAHVVLGDYAKTETLKPGESQTVHLTIDAKDMASYDSVDKGTYVLEKGDYEIKFMENAHVVKQHDNGDIKVTMTVADDILCNTAVTGAAIENRFADVESGFNADYNALKRSDWAGTMPGEIEGLTEVEGYEKASVKEISSEEYEKWGYDDAAFNAYYENVDGVKLGDASKRTSDKYDIVLSDLIGADAEDPRYMELVEQLTLDELIDVVNNGGFRSVSVPYIGKPFSRDTDGPKGWTGNYTDSTDRFNYFVSEPMIASTYNKQIAYDMGEIIGEQGLWGNSTAEGGVAYNYTGWYAPGMNIHRGYFDSRYTEYYSEDPVLTGMTAASAARGAKSKGCYITIKHFAFHQDGGGASTYRAGAMMTGTAREGLSVWMTEQTIRELYLKGYQIAVEDGGATFAMGSFTRIGHTWCGGSYAVNTALLRNEWGFKGAVVTDIVLYNSVNAYQLVKAGCNMMLDSKVYGIPGGIYLEKDKIEAMPEKDRNITIHCMQQAVKQVLYMVANSNAMQIPTGAKINYELVIVEDEEEIPLTALANAKVGEDYSSPALTGATLNTDYAYSEIRYTVSGLPSGLTFDENTGMITGRPEKAGDYNVVITASADGYRSASAQLTLSVEDVERGNGMEIAALVTGIAGLVAGVAAIALVMLVKKKN